MSAMPWGKWFWRDWLSDLELRSVSIAARGVWIDMLCVAAQSTPFGHVIYGGKPIDDTGIAKLCGITLEEATEARIELESAEVFSRNKVGTIYNRRMVRDAAKRAKAVENGKKGGNPNLRKHTENGGSDNAPINHEVCDAKNQHDKQATNGHDKREGNTQRLEARSQRLDENQNPTTPSSSVAARGGEDSKPKAEPSPDELAWRNLRLQITTAFEDANSPVLPDTNWVETWRAKGYNPAVCIALIRDGLIRKPDVGSLKYFDRQLEEQNAKIVEARRQAEGLAPKPAGPNWDHIVMIYHKTGKQAWPHPCPRPGLSGCLAPRDVLTKYFPAEFPSLQS